MTRKDFVAQMNTHGDAFIYYYNSKGKQRFIIGTIDFSTRYIANKPQQPLEIPNAILVFCWDTDKFKQVRLNTVFNIVPLSSVLRNQQNDTNL